MSNLEKLVEYIKVKINEKHGFPFVISLDGWSGSGKTTIASQLAHILRATTISCDDFFAIHIPDHEWDDYPVEEKCRLCIDWERVRKDAVLPLLTGNKAQYHPFSFSTMNGLSHDIVKLEPANILILDGIYSSKWLLDVVDLTILVDVDVDIRRKRHNLRENTEDIEWHNRWDSVEDYYFSTLRPLESFDIVFTNE